MPKLGMTMEEGTVLRWLKAEGDRVKKDEPILEIMTEKVDMLVEAPATGVLRGIRVKEGEVVPVTQVIAHILAEGEALTAEASPAGQVVPAVPAARRLAREAGIDLRRIAGSGPGGRITETDVRAAIARPGAPAHQEEQAAVITASAARETERRRVIARRTAQSAREIPHIYLLRPVDMTAVAAVRGEASYTAAVVAAAARALRTHPALRASLDGDAIVVHDAVHIGVAVDTPAGLVVPVVRDPDKKDLLTLHHEIDRLAGRARDDDLSLDDVAGATFTISNLGMFGVHAFTALINPPQSAILAVGAVAPRPWAVGEAVMVRPVCDLVLGVDHRIADGAAGARFLDDVCRRLAVMTAGG
ncbi:MAG: dihydrolipoamide acetyltransferase family protein [Armatimonadota bacterium]